MPELCTYVTERATEGPCENCTDEWGKHFTATTPEGRIVARCWEDLDDTYLGPVLARCGHTLHCTMHHIGDYDRDCPGKHVGKTEDDIHIYIEAA